MYIHFALSVINTIKDKYLIYVSGDDVLIACEESSAMIIREALYQKVYIRVPGTGGLG